MAMAKRHEEAGEEGGGISSKRSKRELIEVSWLGKVWGFPPGTKAEEALSCISYSCPSKQKHHRLVIVAENEGFQVFNKDEALVQGLKYSVATFGVHKPPYKLQRRFGVGHAVDSDGFYFVAPDVQDFFQDLQNGKYCVLIGRRQSGKTTMVKAVMEQLSKETDACPVYLGGLEVSAKHFTVSEMWAYLWDRLHRACPSLFGKRPESVQLCLSIHFQQLFEKATLQVPLTLMMDEADSLLLLSTECLDDLFHAIREIKQNRSHYNLRSFALIGVETVKDLLEARYKQRHAQLGDGYVPSSTPSHLLPFPHDHTMHPSGFNVADIVDLLQQADIDHDGELTDIPLIAASIMEKTAGHKGLVGVCLAYLMQERAYNIKAWLELTDSHKLGTFVFGQATYYQIMQSFRQHARASQQGRALLIGFLEGGGQDIPKADLSKLRGLLAEGVLAVKEETVLTCFVDLSSPLLRTAILRKCVITDQAVDPPPTPTYVDRKWVIAQAIKTLDGDLMGKPECLTAGGKSSSEYIHQFLFMCRLKAVLCQAYPHIQSFVLPEVKEKQVPGVRRSRLHLDTLVRDGPDFAARMGFELVVDATLESARDHEHRAQEYSEQHSAQVFMINFTKDKPAFLFQPTSDRVHSMAVQFNSEDQTALLHCLDVNGRLEEDTLLLTKWTGVLSFESLV